MLGLTGMTMTLPLPGGGAGTKKERPHADMRAQRLALLDRWERASTPPDVPFHPGQLVAEEEGLGNLTRHGKACVALMFVRYLDDGWFDRALLAEEIRDSAPTSRPDRPDCMVCMLTDDGSGVRFMLRRSGDLRGLTHEEGTALDAYMAGEERHSVYREDFDPEARGDGGAGAVRPAFSQEEIDALLASAGGGGGGPTDD